MTDPDRGVQGALQPAGQGGALNLYSTHPAAFGADSHAAGEVFAAHAALALQAAREQDRIQVVTDGDLDGLYEQAPCGYLSVLDDGTIVRVNTSFLDWAGYQRAEVLGTRLGALLPVGDRMLLTTHCIPLLQMTGAVAEVAIEVIGADRVRRAALLSARRVPAAGDRPALIRVVVFSAHERRRYEKELLGARRKAEQSEAERAAAQSELEYLALNDPLTGLPNRAGLSGRLSAALAACHPGGPRVVVLFLDLDHFKAVNDSLGHAAGDALLTATAGRLRGAVRGSATVARLSGDEFVVVDQVSTPAEATGLAERLLQVLSQPLVIEGLEVVATGSIGVALTDPTTTDPSPSAGSSAAAEPTGTAPAGGGPGAEGEELMRRADIAMYRAKARGRGCWELHDPQHRDPEVDRLHLLGQLRHGIAQDELRLHYQPRVELATGTMQGVEALVRWQHPQRGLLPPSEFIDLAEQTGLIRDLGGWVLDHAIAQAAQWHRQAPGQAVEMAVNLSARQLADPQLVPQVQSCLRRHALPVELLTLEITETALMADAALALAALTSLRALGVRLSIDDFGTGYSSLTYLKRFPVDELKIDMSFVSGLGQDSEDTAIVASCISLAHSVGLRAVAEGVETDQQRRILLDLHCDLAQGYYVGRPTPTHPAPAQAAQTNSPAPGQDTRPGTEARAVS